MPLHQVHHCGRIQKCHGVGVVKADAVVSMIHCKQFVVSLQTTSAGGFDVLVKFGDDLLSYRALLDEHGVEYGYLMAIFTLSLGKSRFRTVM